MPAAGGGEGGRAAWLDRRFPAAAAEDEEGVRFRVVAPAEDCGRVPPLPTPESFRLTEEEEELRLFFAVDDDGGRGAFAVAEEEAEGFRPLPADGARFPRGALPFPARSFALPLPTFSVLPPAPSSSSPSRNGTTVAGYPSKSSTSAKATPHGRQPNVLVAVAADAAAAVKLAVKYPSGGCLGPRPFVSIAFRTAGEKRKCDWRRATGAIVSSTCAAACMAA